MDTKVIPLSDLQADLEGMLRRCYDSGQPLVVTLPDRGLISIQPVESDDDLVNELIEHDSAFQGLLAKSLASPREPFPFLGPEDVGPPMTGEDGGDIPDFRVGRKRESGRVDHRGGTGPAMMDSISGCRRLPTRRRRRYDS